jgi:hypothetical protein
MGRIITRSHPCHDRDKEEEETLPVAVHVLFGKLDANGEYANGDDDTSELESNIINAFVSAITPRTGVENVCPVGT